MSISAARERCGMTQEYLAKKIGVTQGAISQWETGKSMPSVSLLPKLAEMLNCTVDELLREEE